MREVSGLSHKLTCNEEYNILFNKSSVWMALFFSFLKNAELLEHEALNLIVSPWKKCAIKSVLTSGDPFHGFPGWKYYLALHVLATLLKYQKQDVP